MRLNPAAGAGKFRGGKIVIAEEKKLVCPWLPTTLVGDDGTRVAAFEICYREACPYWGGG